MKAQQVYWQVIPVLLASAALGFAQVNNTPAYGGNTPAYETNSPAYRAPMQGAAGINNSVPPVEPVGPGTINYVEGQASLDGQELSPQSIGTATLKPGQTLDTGNGYVEMLLTPGAFLRVGHNSEVRILSAGLADTRVQLARGSAMLEIDQMIKGTNLAVATNGANTQIEKNGLYNFDAASQAVVVLDGKARIQEAAGTQTLGKNDEVLLGSTRPLKKRNVDEKALEAEPLYVWSKARSEQEAQASASAASNAEYYATAGPGWYWDPAWDFYGFWPYADALYSPFGWGFYSPGFFGYGYYGGFYGGRGYYRHPGVGGLHGRVGGVNARVGAFRGGAGGFHGGGFHGGGFHGGGMGGFHGGGGGGRR